MCDVSGNGHVARCVRGDYDTSFGTYGAEGYGA